MLKGQKYRIARPLRWGGRIIASIAASWFVVMLIGSAIIEGLGPMSIESGTLVLLGVVGLAGCVTAWWWDMTAGILLVLTSIGLDVHIGCFAGHSHVLAWSMTGLPYLVAGVLLLCPRWLSRQVQ